MSAVGKGAPSICCPVCSAELTIEQLFAHAEDRQAFARLATLSLPLGSKVLQYISLFAPAKNRMAIARKVKLIEELLPDVARGAIERKGREWKTSHDDWRTAIDRLLSARDAGKLSLPLTSHAYLYETLLSLTDKVERVKEATRERDLRDRRPVGAQPGPTLLSAAIDPALAKIDKDNSRAVPMPAAVRERIAELRLSTTSPSQKESQA